MYDWIYLPIKRKIPEPQRIHMGGAKEENRNPHKLDQTLFLRSAPALQQR
jgi:hypothetical protein